MTPLYCIYFPVPEWEIWFKEPQSCQDTLACKSMLCPRTNIKLKSNRSVEYVLENIIFPGQCADLKLCFYMYERLNSLVLCGCDRIVDNVGGVGEL